jgi:HEPN domain-containing protein
MKRVTEEWLKAAKDDLLVIERIGTEPLLTHMVAFHAQQCIEKSVKAVLEEHEVGTVRVHNLDRLIELSSDYLSLDIDIVTIEKLDKLYIDSRYPGDLGLLPDGKPTTKDSEEFSELAKGVYETVKSYLTGQLSKNRPENA